MLSLILSFLAAGITVLAIYMSAPEYFTEYPVWVAVFAVLAFLIVIIAVSLLLRIFTNRINAKLQEIMAETQKNIQLKQNIFMRKPLGHEQMIRELEKIQFDGIDKMLNALEMYKPLYLWNILLERQVNTMKMMFYYQKRKFDEVDALQEKCLYMDAQSCAMRLARLYLRKDERIEKFYKSKCMRYKGNEAALLACTYAWILVKEEKYDTAAAVLSEAKVSSRDNEVLIHNWEMLVNRKYKHFSNSQLGDMWYALYLEKPKMLRQQQNVRYR